MAYLHPTADSAAPPSDWWQRPGLERDARGVLCLDGWSLERLAAEHGTPTYVYSGARIRANVTRLRAALERIRAPTRLYYAMKSNRHPAVLGQLRTLGVGVDVCSPGEVRHALACGYVLEQLSFTAGALDRRDYAALAGWPSLWVNLDSLTAIERMGEHCPGRRVGIRINPGIGVGYRANPLLEYAGARPTKFGIHLDRFAEALERAEDVGLRVEALHCHAGCGLLTPQLPRLEAVYAAVCRFLEQAPWIRRLNLGGGLGIPLVADDAPLDLPAWAGLVDRVFGGRGLELEFEPGDYLVKDAGVLLVEVTQNEVKGGVRFVGVNAGFNVHPEPVFYRLPLEPVAVNLRDGPRQRITIAGNINEALDLWAEDVELSPLLPGDHLALLNAGGYGASMASRHCLRCEMKEHWIPDEALSTQRLDELNKAAWDRLYGSTAEPIWGDRTTPYLDQYTEVLRSLLPSGGVLLDAGVGEGRNLPWMLDLGAAAVHGIEASQNALDKIPAVLKERVVLRRGDLDATGYPSDYFDLVLLIDVFETLPAVDRVLGELWRVLKPGGLLLLNIPGHDDGVAGVEMQPIDRQAYWYQGRYYFRFVEPDEAEALLRRLRFDVLRADRQVWSEHPHPGFRDDEHQHTSCVFLVRKSV